MIPSPSALQSWFGKQPGFDAATVRTITPFSGGASNITCKVDLEVGEPVVLRLQRERGIFEPYDVLREARVVRHLAGSGIPVPLLLATESDTSVLGAPFAILQFIDAPHMGEAGSEADFGAFTSMVAAIHDVDWRALGLDFLGVPALAFEASRLELEAVTRRMPGFGCEDDRLLSKAAARLQTAIPKGGELALCQGDINVFNYLFRRRQVVAVVDWEQARIGDPRSDIGQLIALSLLKGAPFGPADDASFVNAYRAASGDPLPGMEYFRAFWLFQLGVIHEGWVAFNGSSPWYDRATLDPLLMRALDELR